MTVLTSQQLQSLAGDLGVAASCVAAALLLASLTTAIETTITRRAAGLRRRRGALLLTAALADGVKLLSKSSPPRGPGRTLGVLVALLLAVLLIGGLPAAGGLGGLTAPDTPTDRLLGLAGVLAMVPFALLVHAAMMNPPRRRPLAEVLVTLVGTQASLILCVTAIIIAGDEAADFTTRLVPQWPLWRHPVGALACIGALAILSSALRRAIDGTGRGHPSPGLADGPGAVVLLLRLSRPLLIGASSALAAHLYLGTAQLPSGAIWVGIAIWITLVQLLQAAITDAASVDLSRLLWSRVLPLALIDVLWHLLRFSGVLPWS